MFEQYSVQFMDIIVFMDDEVFDDHIEFAAVGEGIACPGDEILRFIEAQLQCNGKRKRSRLDGL